MKFEQLEKTLRQLRHPETGCPWDIKQTASSLIPNFIEEVYEAVEAIEDDNYPHLCEELGDILLHVVFQVQMAEDKQMFTMDDVLQNVINKLIRRHPHVFSIDNGQLTIDNEGGVLNVQQVKHNWEKIKLAEKKQSRKSVLEGVPKSLPALIQASRIQEKAAAIGFDWDSYEPVFDKIYEEIEEVKEAIENVKCKMENDTLPLPPPEEGELHMELGDLLFAVVNLARKLKIDSESALRKSNEKFKHRFTKVEQLCQERNIDMTEVGLEKLDELWEFAKKI